MNKKLIAIVIAIVLVTMACAPLSILNSGGGTSSNALFQDNFSDTSSGWASSGYSNGAYIITVDQTQYDLYDSPGQSFPADVAIEVDATKIGGPDNNDFGVICRYQDSNNFYFLDIASDGYATIGMYQNGSLSYLLSNSWESTSAVNTGAATNHIKAVCQGNTLTLFANGTQVAQVTDSTFTTGGDAGLIAGTFDQAGTSISFDNFVVTAP